MSVYDMNNGDIVFGPSHDKGNVRHVRGIWEESKGEDELSTLLDEAIKNGKVRHVSGVWSSDKKSVNPSRKPLPGVMVTISGPIQYKVSNVCYDENNAEMPLVYCSGFKHTVDVRCFAELGEIASDILEAAKTDRAWAWLIIDISCGRIDYIRFPDGFSVPIRRMLEKFITRATKKIIEEMPEGKFSIAISKPNGRTTIYVGRSPTPHFEKLNVCCRTLKNSKINIDNCLDLSDAILNIYRVTTRTARATIQIKDGNVSKMDVFVSNAAGMLDSDKRNCNRLLKQATQKIIEQIGPVESEFQISVRTW